MKCPNCGNVILIKKKFCPECGALLETEPEITPSDVRDEDEYDSFDSYDAEEAENTEIPAYDEAEPDEETVEREAYGMRLKMTVLVGAAVVVFVFILLGAFVLFGGSNKTDRPVQQSDRTEATPEPTDRATALRAEVDDIKAKYYSGEYSFEQAGGKLSAYYTDIDAAEYAQAVYDELLEDNNFRSIIAQAKAAYEESDFENALTLFRAALEMRAESAEAQQGIEQSAASYKEFVMMSVDSDVQAESYDSALALLEKAVQLLPDDADLAAKKADTEEKHAAYLKRLHEEKMQGFVDEAQAMVKNNKWDDALDFIKARLKEYPDDEMLTKELNYIKNNMPMNLTNVDMSGDSGVKRSRSGIRDKNGKSYDNYVRFAATDSATAKFSLNKAYTTFTATLFVDKDAKAGKKIMVIIYADGEPLYSKSNITENSSPEKIELNVEGVKTLEIKTLNFGTSGGGFLYFAGSNFKRK